MKLSLQSRFANKFGQKNLHNIHINLFCECFEIINDDIYINVGWMMQTKTVNIL